MLSQEEYYKKIFHQSLTDISKDEIYQAFFSEIVPMLEKEKSFKPLFGNLDGSISRGMSNDTSDVDMHIFGETDNLEITFELEYGEAFIKNRKVTYDIALHAYEVTLKALDDYNSRAKKYPTVFFRTEEEKNTYSFQKIHWNVRYRPDGEIFELLQFLIADSIFIRNKDEVKIGLNQMYEAYRTIDMLDLQFVRAYGNYNNLMKNDQEEILLRKYLYTLYEIFFCNWILEKQTRPPLDFRELLKEQKVDPAVFENILQVFELNHTATEHKSKQMCTKQPVINEYVFNELIVLEKKISEFDPKARYSQIIENTEKSRRQKIYYF